MTPIERRFELRKRRITQKSIAEELGKHPITIGLVINGKLNSAALIQAISDKIEKSPQEVFPEYFEPRSKRLKRRGRRAGKGASSAKLN
jgi:transcriptional regulator with XRE-family HTH domain